MSPNMNHETSPALVPKLRFPEFRAAEPWREITIASILKVRDTRRVPSAEAPLFSLTIENGITKKSDRYDREFLVRDAGNKTYKLVEPSDIVYNPSNLRWGAISYSQLSHPVVVSPIYEVLSLVNDSEVFCFVATSVMRDAQIRRCITKAQGTLVERIAVKIDDFLSTNLPVPPGRPEQQRIADCLGSLDELVAAQARKVEALKAHKKGLMQQLFPQEGETQPRLRFPEFQYAGEWHEAKLDDVALFQDGFAFKSTDFIGAQPGATQVVRITDINNKNANEEKVYVPTFILEDNKLQRHLVTQGDLLLSLTGAAGFNFFFWNAESAVLNQRTARVVQKNPGTALLKILEPLIHDKINARGEGQNNNLSKEFLSAIVLRVPKAAEQQRIADCLTSLDDLITAESTKLSALKTHKKGLMQQLFPAPAEVEA